MEPYTVLVTAKHLAPAAQQMLRDAGATLEFMPEPITEDTLIARLSSGPAVAGVILRGNKPFTARVLAAARHTKIIAKHGAGVDTVDFAEAARSGIAVAVAAGCNADAVAEHTVALMLALTRNVGALDRKVRRGGWEDVSYLGRDFRGSLVGIVGYGSIGRSTARLASALGAKVVVLRRSGSADDFEVLTDLAALLERVDLLSLHCPLTPQTRGLISSRELGLMKKGALLVNTARGPIVDETALIEALISGQVAGAGLDTFETEPLTPGSPLLALDNVILTPHVAGYTHDAALRVATTTARNVIDYLSGRALPDGHVVAGPGRRT